MIISDCTPLTLPPGCCVQALCSVVMCRLKSAGSSSPLKTLGSNRSLASEGESSHALSSNLHIQPDITHAVWITPTALYSSCTVFIRPRSLMCITATYLLWSPAFASSPALVSATSAMCSATKQPSQLIVLAFIRFLHAALLLFQPGNVPTGWVSAVSAATCGKQTPMLFKHR